MQILHAREAHIRLDSIWDCFHGQDVGVAVIDAEERLVLCTPAASRLLNRRVIPPGRTPGFPLGKPISPLVTAVRRDGRAVHEVVELDGGRTVDVSLSLLGSSVLAVLDEAPQLQASLRHQQLLTAGAYHELRNPLTTVIGYLGLLMQEGPSQPDDASRGEYQRVMRHECDRMVRLLNDMLTLTSVEEHGKVELIERPDDIGTVLRWCVEHTRFGLDTHALQLYVDANLPRASMDRDRIVQVVDNLISNAVKYSPPGSSIRVDAYTEGGCIKVTVSDSGPGIALEDQKKLFDCYFRASREAPGHGIGLFVCRTLVEAHGGQLGVVSAPGFGSAFWFTIPL